ncbi:MAG: ATP-binding cassette domain-containing protein [Chloroflexi bacterium]|nr:ATP-binding cassette domain-containing protein [Chloroflexota bacterium]
MAIKDVFKIYREGQVETVALRGVSLAVEAGEMVAIVGPSGSGKSTLLNLIGGLDTPSAGQVWVGEQNIGALPEAERARLRRQQLGFVFQDYNLLPFMTAAENIVLALHFAGTQHASLTAAELLSEVGLADRLDHRPAALSGGEQQRVAIACALANQPAVLLADEPTGELDSLTAQAIMELLIAVNRSHRMTIILVTHDPAVAAYAQRVIHMRDGEIVNEEVRHE